MRIETPSSAISTEQIFSFPVEPDGPIARDSITACNSNAGGSSSGLNFISVSVPVLWRVTTGKFNFRWTDYNLVGPNEDFKKDPNFYSDRKVFEQQASATVRVTCEPLGAQQAIRDDAGKLHLGQHLISHIESLEGPHEPTGR